MVLVHGQGENWATWQRILPEFARTHRVYAIDLPGSGKSERLLTAASTPSFYSDLLKDFLHAFDLENVTLIGHSYGGLISLRVALADQERVAALCLVDSAALGHETSPLLVALSLPLLGETMSVLCSTPLGRLGWTWMFAMNSFFNPHLVPVAWYSNASRLVRNPAHLLTSVISPVRGQVSPTGQREILLNELAQLNIPTLIIWGENDRVVPHYHGTSAMRHLRQGRMVKIPRCGHMPQVEQPTAFVAAVSSFLDDFALQYVMGQHGNANTAIAGSAMDNGQAN